MADALEDLASGDGRLADGRRGSPSSTSTPCADARARSAPTALTVAQLFLHADIDPALAAVGAGDNGGIATLLVRLGDALVADRRTGCRRA